jgi:hypothetical protein
MKNLKFAFALLLGFILNASLYGQKEAKIEEIFDNPGKYENEQVVITGIVTQYFLATTQTTSYYILKGDYGGVININTSIKPPAISKKYKISGVVVIDQVQGRPVIIEKSRTMVLPYVVYFLVGVVMLLIVFLIFFVIRSKKSQTDNKGQNLDLRTIQPAAESFSTRSSSEQEYATIRISAGPPPTMILIPGELEIVMGLDKGKTFRIAGYPTNDGSVVTMGREAVEGDRKYSHIQLMEKTVSRRQAELIYKNNILYIKNLSETNYTQIDGRPLGLNEAIEIKSGTSIRTGEVEFRYKR